MFTVCLREKTAVKKWLKMYKCLTEGTTARVPCRCSVLSSRNHMEGAVLCSHSKHAMLPLMGSRQKYMSKGSCRSMDRIFLREELTRFKHKKEGAWQSDGTEN